jgi:hypothetical protein
LSAFKSGGVGNGKLARRSIFKDFSCKTRSSTGFRTISGDVYSVNESLYTADE